MINNIITKKKKYICNNILFNNSFKNKLREYK